MMHSPLSRRLLLTAAPLLALAPALAAPAAGPTVVKAGAILVPDNIKTAVASPRRPAEDVKRDSGRKPGETMAFFGVKPGMKVAELMTSKGYFTAVLAEIVGETGKVYGQNNKWVRDRFKDNTRPLSQLVDKQGYTNIVELNTELEDPQLPAGLDAVFMVMFYHDLYWMNVDRAALNKAVLAALKPGGVYGIIDHHAQAGSGISDVNKNHRIERHVVIEDVTKAGFVLAEETDLLENMKDPLTVPVFQQELRGSTHQFVLKFKKPA